MKSAWNLIHTQSTPDLVPQEATEWKKILPLLEQQGLAGETYSRWKEHLPEEVRVPLREQWQRQWMRNSVFQAELKDLAPAFHEIKVTPVLLKGAALLETIYAEDIGARAISDIDLLIEDPKAFKATIAMLKRRGYEDVPSLRWEANAFKHNLSRYREGYEITLELHQNLFWKSRPRTTDRNLPLNPEETLVHLMGHLGFQHTFLRLNWLVDIDRWIRRCGRTLNWETVFKGCQETRTHRSSQAVLFACKEFLGTPGIPETMLPPHKLPWRPLLSSDFLWNSNQHRFRYYFLKHLLKDSLYDAILYDWLWLWRGAWKHSN